jgi:cyclopropane fatty-acyl-phospholipid synthase-like methyltransferase
VGARPADWAVSEDQQTPTYGATLERIALEPGQTVLDIGCGAGAFLRLVSEHGARACGLDASENLIAFARRRLPDADLRVGEMEALPYQDDTFDLVTGFNAFFFASDIVGVNTTWAFDYPDQQTVRRALVAPMGIATQLGDQEQQFTDALVKRLQAHRTPDGHYQLHNEYHTLIARA